VRLVNVALLRRESLPAVSTRAVAASRAAGGWLGGLGGELAFTLRGVGPVVMSFDGFETCDMPSTEALTLVGADGRRGELVVDRALALTMLAGMLGRDSPRVVRRLGTAERGIMAAQLLPLVTQFGGHVTLALNRAPRAEKDALVSVALRASALGAVGRVRMDLPIEWLSYLRSGARSRIDDIGQARRLRVVASAALGATTITGGAWSTAGLGDAIVFDGVACPSPSEAWPISVRIGAYAATALLDHRGSLSEFGPFEAAGLRVGSLDPSLRSAFNKETAVMPDDHNLAVLAAAPIEVVAEIGRLTLRGDEVLGLARGSVLSFGSRGGAISLIAGGELWARGELVDVDGELGVRVIELIRP
jgi:flagellar motor switch/type III secretory pathway protein FliN